MRILTLIGFLIIFISCKEDKKELTAQQIIDKTIENAGGSKYDLAKIQFTFREIQYSSHRNKGAFELTRTITDSLGETRDVLTNSGFERFANATKLTLADSTVSKYSNSLNSVHYFVQLPYGLNDSAVNKELVGEAEIDGKDYYEVQVTFAQNGGGVDHEDVYMYWIAKDDFTIDYFAYKFYTGKGGIRFRKAINPRMVNGLRFVDYENYKLEPWESVDMQTVDELFEAGKLELLSEIITEDVTVVVPKPKAE
ncbi:deoxyribose-phosphate aldolase [Aequorivita viscosa]|nr:deoxyribose-phosphate aldolase [Aequorivita viscosa]